MKTRIFCKEPGQNEYLMNEIEPTSKFTNTKWPAGLDPYLATTQAIVAQDIINGWKTNGNKPANTIYRIEHDVERPRR